MKYYLYVLDNDERIECTDNIAALIAGDYILKGNVTYMVENKAMYYNSGYVDINVHIAE